MNLKSGSQEIICHGFSLPYEKSHFLRIELANLAEESPCDADIKFSLAKEHQIYHLMVSVNSSCGEFVARQEGSDLDEAVKLVIAQISDRLNDWKVNRFSDSIKSAA